MRKIKVTVIDDEIDLGEPRREVYESIFKDFKLELLGVEEEFNEFIKKRTSATDVVIIDENLNFWKEKRLDVVLRELEEKLHNIPIIMISKDYPYSGYTQNRQRTKYHNIIDKFNYGDFKTNHVDEKYKDEISCLIRTKLCEYYGWVDKFINDDKFTILHISDFQYGDPKSSEHSYAGENILASFLMEEDTIPDVIVVTGDVTSEGTTAEYKEFYSKIIRLMQDLRLDPKENLVIVPGNHDIDRRMLKLNDISIDINKEDSYSGFLFKKFCDEAYNLTNEFKYLKYDNKLNFQTQKFLLRNIRFLNLNNVSNVSDTNHKDYSFDKKAIENLIKEVARDRKNNEIIIGVGHAPIAFSQDCSKINNENVTDYENDIPNEFLRLAQTTKMKIYLSGHTHATKFMVADKNKLKSTLIESTASSYRLGEAVLNGDKKRGFNIIEISYDEEYNPIEISGNSYEFNKGGIRKMTKESHSFRESIANVDNK